MGFIIYYYIITSLCLVASNIAVSTSMYIYGQFFPESLIKSFVRMKCKCSKVVYSVWQGLSIPDVLANHFGWLANFDAVTACRR